MSVVYLIEIYLQLNRVKVLSLRAEKAGYGMLVVSIMYSNICEVAMKKTPNMFQEER